LPFLNLLSAEGKVTLLKALTQSLTEDRSGPDYVIYNTRYTHRLCNDAMVNRIQAYLDENGLESQLLYIWNDTREEPYFKVFTDSEEKEPLEEHPEARAVFEAVRSVTRPGIMVDHRDCPLLEFIQAVMKCQHCGCLSPDPYNVEQVYAVVNGGVRNILILDFDTESG
jgi:hypothetical protein